MSSWTIDRIKTLSTADVRQLRKNADLRKREDVVVMCDEVLSGARKASAATRVKKKKAPPAVEAAETTPEASGNA